MPDAKTNVWPGMSKLIEEMGELNQVLGKLMATGGEPEHWDGTDLHDRLAEEVADVLAAVEFFRYANEPLVTRIDFMDDRESKKIDLFCKWYNEKEANDELRTKKSN